jgi:hypothetical protein
MQFVTGQQRQPEAELGGRYQALADDIWALLIDASDEYFRHGSHIITGDERAPEFSDDQVLEQFVYFNRYRTDRGAMSWRRNDTKEFVYDFEALPLPVKRALCQRIWVKCKEAGLGEDEQWRRTAQAMRTLGTDPAGGTPPAPLVDHDAFRRRSA